MSGRTGQVDIAEDIREYLSEITQSFKDVLGGNLVGLYLCGSLVQNDFEPHRSDIDLLGIVSTAPDEATRDQLVSRLSHAARAVPARGLEVVLFPADAVQSPGRGFTFAFALSTSPEGEVECAPPGIADDMLIDIALCRDAGIALAGPPANMAFAPISQNFLCHALIDELRWHQREVQKRLDDTAAVNAILNAARSLHAAQTGQILSKTEGGRWWLKNYPLDDAVAWALSCRESGQGIGSVSLAPAAAIDFVDAVIHRIKALSN